MFLNGKPFEVTKSKLVLVTPEGQTANGVSISLNGGDQTGFTWDAADKLLDIVLYVAYQIAYRSLGAM